MAKNTVNDNDIDVSFNLTGADQATRQINTFVNAINNITNSLSIMNKSFISATRNISKTINQLQKLNSVQNITDNNKQTFQERISNANAIVKSRNNRLNVGDLANIETGTVANKVFTSLDTETKKLLQDIDSLSRRNQTLATNTKSATNETKKFTKSINDSNKSTKKHSNTIDTFSKKLSNLARNVFLGGMLGSTLNSLVEQSGSWIENLNLFTVTFGDTAEETLDWAIEFSNRLGVSNNEIVKMIGLFKQLSTSFGIADEVGDELSYTLTQLAYDLSSFYNIDIESATEKLQSGIFSGEIRPLREIGIDVSEDSINTLLETNEALRQFGFNMADLTQSQKVLARTILTMQAATNSFGDFANTIDTLQNRARVFEGSLANLRLALGDAISEPTRQTLAYLIGFTQAVTNAIRAFVPLQEATNQRADSNNILTDITEDAEEANQAVGQLSFDRFESLTSGEDENLSITEALTSELQKQQEIYNQIASQYDGIDEEVVRIRNNIMQWIFPYAEIDEATGEILNDNKELNTTLTTLIDTVKVLWNNLRSVFNIFVQMAPTLQNVTNIILNISNAIIRILDNLNLLEPVLLLLVGLNIYSKLSNVFKVVTNLISGFRKLVETIVTKVITAWTNWNKKIDESIDKTLSFGNAIEETDKKSKRHKATQQELASAISNTIFAIGSAIISIVSLVKNWDNMSEKAKGWTIAIGVLTGVIAMAAAAYYAFTQNWAKAIAVAGMVIATGTSVMTAISGFENGGIPEKSELFYMNEHGVPEALVNTGGSQTNVINMDQLAEGMRRGFVQAIQDTGLNRQRDVSVTLSPNSDSSFARALFPALKQESRRRGGNQL